MLNIFLKLYTWVFKKIYIVLGRVDLDSKKFEQFSCK